MPAIEGVTVAKVEGTVTLTNGETVQFLIMSDEDMPAESGWQQWGNTHDVLWTAQPAVAAMADAVHRVIEEGE